MTCGIGDPPLPRETDYRRKPFHPSFRFLPRMISDSWKPHTSLHLHRKPLACQTLVRIHIRFEFNSLVLSQSILMIHPPSRKFISNLRATRLFHSLSCFSHLRLSQNYQPMPRFPPILCQCDQLFKLTLPTFTQQACAPTITRIPPYCFLLLQVQTLVTRRPVLDLSHLPYLRLSYHRMTETLINSFQILVARPHFTRSANLGVLMAQTQPYPRVPAILRSRRSVSWNLPSHLRHPLRPSFFLFPAPLPVRNPHPS